MQVHAALILSSISILTVCLAL